MKEVTSAARGQRFFPVPIDIDAGRGGDESEADDENKSFQKAESNRGHATFSIEAKVGPFGLPLRPCPRPPPQLCADACVASTEADRCYAEIAESTQSPSKR